LVAIAASNADVRVIRIYHWGQGKFDTSQFDVATTPIGLSPSETEPAAAADFDGDGIDELVLSCNYNTMLIYRYADTGFVDTPWFRYQTFANKDYQNLGVNVGDLNGDSIPDLLLSTWRDTVGERHGYELFFLPGRHGTTPDSTSSISWVSPFRADTTIYHFDEQFLCGPILRTGKSDYAYSVVHDDGIHPTISRIYLYEGKSRPLVPSDFDTGNAAVVIHDPIEYQDGLNPYRAYGTALLGSVNGSGQPCLVRGATYPFGFGVDLFIYSGGNAMDGLFDAYFPFQLLGNNSAAETRGVVDIGDITGDGIDDFTACDYYANPDTLPHAGVVYFIAGSGAIPHKPVRTSVAERDELSPIRMEVYPTPAQDRATIHFQLASNESDATVRVIDALGRVINEQHGFARGGGWYTLPVDARALPAGSYRCVVETSREAKWSVLQVVH
jgi:hypothetical protein